MPAVPAIESYIDWCLSNCKAEEAHLKIENPAAVLLIQANMQWLNVRLLYLFSDSDAKVVNQ